MSEYSEILDRIEGVLEEKVRPNLALHGGNIRSLDCKDGVYRFQLTGQCAGCPSAMLTTESLRHADHGKPDPLRSAGIHS